MPESVNRGRLVRIPDADFAALKAKANREGCGYAEMLRRLLARDPGPAKPLEPVVTRQAITRPASMKKPLKITPKKLEPVTPAPARPSFWESRDKLKKAIKA